LSATARPLLPCSRSRVVNQSRPTHRRFADGTQPARCRDGPGCGRDRPVGCCAGGPDHRPEVTCRQPARRHLAVNHRPAQRTFTLVQHRVSWPLRPPSADECQVLVPPSGSRTTRSRSSSPAASLAQPSTSSATGSALTGGTVSEILFRSTCPLTILRRHDVPMRETRTLP